MLIQECIPVGCAPAARRPYSEVCCSGGGGCLVRGGVVGSAPGGGVWSGGGVSAPGGGSALGRGCLLRGGLLPGGCLPGTPPGPDQVPPPVNRMTDACKLITLPQTSFAGGKNCVLALRE